MAFRKFLTQLSLDFINREQGFIGFQRHTQEGFVRAAGPLENRLDGIA